MSEKKKVKFSLLRVIVIAVVISALLRFFVFEKFKIYSVSMLPTMQHGEWDFVTKYNYGYSRYSFPFNVPIPAGERWFGRYPERGDVAVFKSTRERERWPYVKRVIGVPGDRVAMQNGRLIINGVLVEREEIEGFEMEDHRGRLHIYHQYIETLPGGVRHKILEISDDRTLDNVPEIYVPEGFFLFMGDNRDESEDSRGGLGLIPFENIIGKAVVKNF